jgi:hypothetical protein
MFAMSAPASVTFETKCWEQDWEVLLKTDRLEQMIARNQFPFAARVLIINNVDDVAEVSRHAQAAVERGVLTAFHVAADHAEEALRFFEIERHSFGPGYVYSIAELVGIYLCRTEFLLHFSSDSILRSAIDWVMPSIALFREDPTPPVVGAVNPMWHARRPHREKVGESADYLASYGFSDQCYFVRTSDFRAPIYNETHPGSERFPKYGGQLFEKRVDSWMLNHRRFRLTYKHAFYDHENIRKDRATIDQPVSQQPRSDP